MLILGVKIATSVMKYELAEDFCFGYFKEIISFRAIFDSA